MTRRRLRLGLALLALAGSLASLLVVRVERADALAERAAAVCLAVQQGRHRDAVARSELLAPLSSEAGRQLAECRCWAQRALEREPECTQQLDAQLVPAVGGADWVPPAVLVRPVIRARLDRGEVERARVLARLAVEAHPGSLHLLELLLESEALAQDEEHAFGVFARLIAEREARRSAERDAAHALEARLVLGIGLLRRGEAARALEALGETPPPADHPQHDAWFHNRANAQASLGDLSGVQASMRAWRAAGLPEAEANARYAVHLSMAGLPDPRRDFVPLLRAALSRQDEIEDPLIVAWLYQRLISHLLVEGRPEEALAAFDEGRARFEIEGISRVELVRAVARASAEGGASATAPRGRLRFLVRGAPAGAQLRVSPDAHEPSDRDYERHPVTSDAAIEIERELALWPLRWVLAGADERPLASGSVWPEPGRTLTLEVEPGAAPAAPDYGVGPRSRGDGRRRIFVVILDCADWRLVQYLRARGELPLHDALFARGLRAVLRSDPPLTAAAMESLVWPARGEQASVIGFAHRMGLELGGLEGVGRNPLGFLEQLLPGSESFFEVLGGGRHVTANMLFSHGAIDAGHHAEVIGPDGRRRALELARVQRPLAPDERDRLGAIVETPRYLRLAERIAGEFDAAQELVQGREIDLLMLRVEALDLLTHSLFSALAGGGRDDGEAGLLAVYRYLDRRLAELDRSLDADDLLVVMSDHGIRNAMEHESDAIFVAVGAGVAPGRVPGQPDLRGVPRLLAEWLDVPVPWPGAGLEGAASRHASR